jgi:hypothetical protein
MKRAREILSKFDGNRKAVVFRKKGSTELLGFTTELNLPLKGLGIGPPSDIFNTN